MTPLEFFIYSFLLCIAIIIAVAGCYRHDVTPKDEQTNWRMNRWLNDKRTLTGVWRK